MPEPIGLTDLVRKTAKVDIDGRTLTIYAVTTKDIAALLMRFPKLQGLMLGRGIEMADLLTVAPESLSAIIATCCGMTGDEVSERIAGELPIETQTDILAVAAGITFTRGFGPFKSKLQGMLDGVSGQATKAQPTNSGKPSASLVERQIQASGN